MQIERILIAAAVFGLAGIGAANATCTANPTGVWNFFAAQNYPGATSKASAITCDLTFGSAGAFTGSCTSYHTGTSSVDAGNSVSGTLTMHAACNFTGSITTPDGAVTIQDGHINGNIGSGVATQKAGAQERVLLFTLLKR
jgi:hypothetical protein